MTTWSEMTTAILGPYRLRLLPPSLVYRCSIVDKYPKLKGFVLKFKELESNVEYKSLCG